MVLRAQSGLRLLCRLRYASLRSASESTLDSGRSRSLDGDGEDTCGNGSEKGRDYSTERSVRDPPNLDRCRFVQNLKLLIPPYFI